MSELVERNSYPVDLQVHSTKSDGTDAPAVLVARAASLGVHVLALTDHDTVDGIDEALAAGLQEGVEIVPALEFSTRSELDRDFLDINVLAYGINRQNPDLVTALAHIVDSRIEQKVRQIERLQRYGIDAPVDEVLESAGGVPGRMHIARVALARNPQHFSSLQDVFDQFLATDAPNSTYVARTYSLRVEEAIELAHAAGGIAVLAHPGAYPRIKDIENVVRRLAQSGLDGIEVRYTYAQNRGQFNASPSDVAKLIDFFAGLAKELSLLATGGSDYHGTAKPGIDIGQAGLTIDEWRQLAPQLYRAKADSCS